MWVLGPAVSSGGSEQALVQCIDVAPETDLSTVCKTKQDGGGVRGKG